MGGKLLVANFRLFFSKIFKNHFSSKPKTKGAGRYPILNICNVDILFLRYSFIKSKGHWTLCTPSITYIFLSKRKNKIMELRFYPPPLPAPQFCPVCAPLRALLVPHLIGLSLTCSTIKSCYIYWLFTTLHDNFLLFNKRRIWLIHYRAVKLIPFLFN